MPDFGRWTLNGGDPSLNEINRADRFIDALSTAAPVYSTDAAEAELAFLLSDWRDEVRDAPITAPVTAGDAVVALHRASARRRSRAPLALVGSVAAAMLCIGGFGTAVYGAGPGDSLYGMRTAIFGQREQTRDDQVSLASAQLQQVQQLIDQGQWQQAQDKLVQVSSAVQDVDRVESKQQLVDQWNALTYKVVEQDPAATLPPGEPLPVLTSSPLTWLPAPVVEATTTSETSETSITAEPTTTSGSAVTSATSEPSDSPLPPEVLLTTAPDASTDPSATTPSTTPSTSTATTVSPTSTTATTTTTSSTAPTATTTTTTTTRAVPQVAAEPPASPASQPRLAPSSPKPEPPAPVESTQPLAPSAPVVPSPQPKTPTTTTSVPQESAAGTDSGAVVTTTIVPPR